MPTESNLFAFASNFELYFPYKYTYLSLLKTLLVVTPNNTSLAASHDTPHILKYITNFETLH
jgi:hypothetical protein